jgi:hypothetical protein
VTPRNLTSIRPGQVAPNLGTSRERRLRATNLSQWIAAAAKAGPPSYNLDRRREFGFCGGGSARMLAIFAENA